MSWMKDECDQQWYPFRNSIYDFGHGGNPRATRNDASARSQEAPTTARTDPEKKVGNGKSKGTACRCRQFTWNHS